MYVRVKTTPNSPRKSVQIVQSVRKGKSVSQKIVRHVGIAFDETELEQLKLLAESIKIKLEAEEQQLLFTPEEMAHLKNKQEKELPVEKEEDYKVDLRNLEEEQRLISGIHDIYGTLFEELGFTKVLKHPARNKASARILKDIVLARIANPQSKRASVESLEELFGISLNLNRVYQMMDKLTDESIEKIKDVACQTTLTLFQNSIDVLFYDCTTIYFESFEEDELRKNGYSKDLKFNQPQVLLALMVTKEGLPVGYELFEGSMYEGHTLIESLEKLKKRFKIEKAIFVADAGMMNEENLRKLEEAKLEYIVGSRIKNLPKDLEKDVLDLTKYSGEEEFKLARFDYKGRDLIVSYSEKRAKKDFNDRLKSVKKLEKSLSKKKNPKEYLSNYGNKKYLKINGEAQIDIDAEKIEQASRWDGLHGVVTNAKGLGREEILNQYGHLWQVEEAFRVTKHDLSVRPVFHWKPERVKAHFAISFIAYTLVKYLEYRVKLQYKKMSPERIRQTLIKVQTSVLYDHTKKIRYGFPSRMSDDAKKIYKICQTKRHSSVYIIEKSSA